MSPEPNESVHQFRTAVIIHVAFMASLPVYGLVVALLKRDTGPLSNWPQETATLSPVRYAFFGAAVIVILLVRRLPGWLWPFRSEGGSAADRMLRRSILTSALCEIPAVLGLTLTLLMGMTRDFIYLSGLSLILFLMYLPRRSQWRDGGG